MHPGQCWAFRGSEGFLVIQLAAPVSVTAFSYEHIPQRISPSGSVDSAPKTFSVFGLSDENDTEGTLLGNFEYKVGRTVCQFNLLLKYPPVLEEKETIIKVI